MKSDRMSRPRPAWALRVAAFALMAVLVSRPGFAQFDLTGKWASRSGQDAQERGPGPDAVDYTGLPLSDEGRERALSLDYSLLSLPEGQCGYHTQFYIVLGPFGLHIWNEFDPVSARVIAWKIGGWVDRDVTTIWMDGRPHPSPNAPRTYSGFTTGRWEGDTLVTTTTHMKADMIRRNGAPVSDEAVMTMYFFRHGDLLTIRAVVDDPVYLAEPLVRSRVWALDRDGKLNLGNGVVSPCEPIAELPRADVTGLVPHHLPGQNPFVNEMTEKYNLPREAVLGGPETLYPEFRKKLKGYVPPAVCKRYCGCEGLGVPCLQDGSGVAR
jgi:hypothetical protein